MGARGRAGARAGRAWVAQQRRRRGAVTGVWLLPTRCSAHAEWKILSAESEPGRAVIEHRHVVVEDASAGQRVAVDVAVFSAKSTALRVVDNPDGQSLGAVMKREKCVCGVNSGYFDTQFKPIGLRIADGT